MARYHEQKSAQVTKRVLSTHYEAFMKQLVFSIVFALFSQAVIAQQADETQVMPEWQLLTQDGSVVRSDDFAGKPLVLHFWATWCPYCKRLQPGLDKLQQDYASKGLSVLAVSLQEKPGAQPQTELEHRGLTLKTVVNGESLGLGHFAIRGTPTTVFIAPDGKILGSTMQSDPQDPQWKAVAEYLVSLPQH